MSTCRSCLGASADALSRLRAEDFVAGGFTVRPYPEDSPIPYTPLTSEREQTWEREARKALKHIARTFRGKEGKARSGPTLLWRTLHHPPRHNYAPFPVRTFIAVSCVSCSAVQGGRLIRERTISRSASPSSTPSRARSCPTCASRKTRLHPPRSPLHRTRPPPPRLRCRPSRTSSPRRRTSGSRTASGSTTRAALCSGRSTSSGTCCTRCQCRVAGCGATSCCTSASRLAPLSLSLFFLRLRQRL